jgi:hypothetical protein
MRDPNTDGRPPACRTRQPHMPTSHQLIRPPSPPSPHAPLSPLSPHAPHAPQGGLSPIKPGAGDQPPTVHLSPPPPHPHPHPHNRSSPASRPRFLGSPALAIDPFPANAHVTHALSPDPALSSTASPAKTVATTSSSSSSGRSPAPRWAERPAERERRQPECDKAAEREREGALPAGRAAHSPASALRPRPHQPPSFPSHLLTAWACCIRACLLCRVRVAHIAHNPAANLRRGVRGVALCATEQILIA